ncbi:MAG: hypothetical protein K0S32_2576 [Bacteroidetes bacterium]|jgi:hypothetical protein|nr:hypothetical protein [Bacteroidota bacterium]
MKAKESVEHRYLELKEKLELIIAEMDKEMDKEYKKRDLNLLNFLYKEKQVYSFAVREFKDILGYDEK